VCGCADERKTDFAFKIPSLGRGAAGCERAGRGIYAILEDDNHLKRLSEQFGKPLPTLPREGKVRFIDLSNTVILANTLTNNLFYIDET